MDADRFDTLVRSLASRRALLGGLAALTATGLVPAAARRKKLHDPEAKRKKHPHRSHGCPVVAAPEGRASHTVQTTFHGQLLRAEQTVDSFGPNGEQAGRLAVTLSAAPVLTLASAVDAAGVATATVTYGDAFAGIRRVEFANDGSMITGEVDGRAIAPLPVDADPSQLQFADGGPPPGVKVDQAVIAAVRALFKQAANETAACDMAAPLVRRGSVRPADCPGDYFPCQVLDLACLERTRKECKWRVYSGGHRGEDVDQLLAELELEFDLCVFERLRLCAEPASDCWRLVHTNPACCPEGTEACFNFQQQVLNCCTADEVCTPDGECCGAGYKPCGSGCCKEGNCRDGVCCLGHFCADQPDECCPSPGNCCGGRCCAGVCNGTACCRNGETKCGEGCCRGVCCDGVCCDGDCENGQCCVQLGGLCGYSSDCCGTNFCNQFHQCDAAGPCGSGCLPGWDCCGESCVDLQNDQFNCGACGVVCGDPAVCEDGQCRY